MTSPQTGSMAPSPSFNEATGTEKHLLQSADGMFKGGCARTSLAETGGAGAGQEVDDHETFAGPCGEENGLFSWYEQIARR